MAKRFVVSLGNPYLEGMSLHGPFSNAIAALTWAKWNSKENPTEKNANWNVVPINDAEDDASVTTSDESS